MTAFVYNLRYPGQYYDSETGLSYNYFRDADPQTGRYIESDPVGIAAGVNTYTYVLNRPTQFVDPAGTQAAIPVAAAAGLGAIAICAATPSCRDAAKNISDALNRDPVIDPTKPLPPQLPGYIDPRTVSTSTQAESCPPMREPPSPRDRCFNGVALQFSACMQSGKNPFICQAQRILGLLFCSAQSSSLPPDNHH
jgi:RHS repeat-associated protein